ncbi:MAG: UDP-3-O-(3-hydroxymyristoyl)glucosamine N-acyltransferase [Meiothermus sp.]|uniref:UDP-3-O-(3-hydroxymyristoyl)glucosamine N-acyltransferase n=1 Tax=Meiothermus sp. TaxID=1955249 RepID=UPI0025E5F3D5|nr:UDP-3-O-(3-hydroxymyristoyl)glucosamine N-acyltransferase [Meiothermus sp.]MCS7057890.1 UDP-3-O-(3-hydroxymyristoyl)glucosamine N-acyltransferase [Meiothermus sp.]MCS7194234.1 UDP-3-O-(3-hydroxymyristoyl)glucosamine N-acyltransferase [Meiothermus sp.]MCX7740476.1 UDP-3-O-(3-hydroxymyristoyl)glucosamine N-acyltransferase [Meiothermus sp.]MDW8090095.1 UDP-3-O-(3-hydroxymyristoyl)glucosamine N-acyltransferase [Meiothermus sp.]MDW8480745.1 UDP-3-O-(3-hydroxymyristoyl)glucosamine N-acyltransfera
MWLSEIAQRLGGRLEGPDLRVSRLAPPEEARPGELVVVREERYLEAALASGAALLMEEGVPCPASISRVRVASVYKAWPEVLALFDQPERWAAPGVHPTAVVEAGAHIDPTAAVGAYAYVGSGARVAAGAVVAPYCYVGEGVEVGPRTVLEPRATLYPNTRVGADCRIGAGAVLGVVGFGLQDGQRLPHVGRVVLEDGVEIGAHCVVQRSVVGETRIGAQTKIGDLTDIGHNVRIGRRVVMVGSSGVGGSAVIEDEARLGGWVAISDHVRVGRRATVAGGSAVSKTVPPGEVWAGGVPALPIRRHWRRLALLEWLLEAERALRRLVKGA